jgi:hypothetical protein
MIQFVRLILISPLLFTQPAFAEQAVDLQSGLLIDVGYKAVKLHCSTCHSPKIIVQNQASRQGWLDTIRWMQKKQGMSLLNEQNENMILNYLAKNYAPNKKNQRTPLKIKKWYKY